MSTFLTVPLTVAADMSTGFDPYSLIASAGVAGAFAFAFAVGKIRSKAEVDDLRADRDAAREQLATLQASLIQQVIPALTNSTSAVERLSRRLDQ